MSSLKMLAGSATLSVAACVAAQGAHAAGISTPIVACQTRNFEEISACVVELADYATDPQTGAAICPDKVTTTGPAKICHASFANAMADARLFFANPATMNQTYVIQVANGSYDLTADTPPQAGHGVLDVSNVSPAGTGCLNPGGLDGTVTLSGSGCLVVSGAGVASVTTEAGIPAIVGWAVSHVMFQHLTMIQPNRSTSQGTYVTAGKQTLGGVDYPTVTLDITEGAPTPLDLYNLDCDRIGDRGCRSRNVPRMQFSAYARAYTNAAHPQLVASITPRDLNAQDGWGFPHLLDHPVTMMPPTQADRTEFPRRWTLTMSTPAVFRGIPAAYSGTSGGQPNLICLKVDNANAFWFDDLGPGGTDVIMNKMIWIGAARGTFRGITGTMQGGLGAQVYHSSIERGAGNLPCLSTQSGGLQFGQPDDPPIWGNLVYGLQADATGDDSIAMFNDVGGTRDGQGGRYPQTVIAQSDIANSFARDILLFNRPHHSHLAGNSPVLVDAATQANIIDHGNCDALVLGTGNCPVTYVTY